MLANFKKLNIYNPYHDFVVYLVPVFAVYMYGFYVSYPWVQQVSALSSGLSMPLQFFVGLVLFMVLGKILHELSAYILNSLHHITVRMIHSLSSGSGFMSRIGKKMYGLIPSVGEEEVPETVLNEYLEAHPLQKNWYARTRMTALSMQTGLGAIILGFFAYKDDRIFILFVFVLILLLALGAKSRLSHAEALLEEHIRLKK